LALNNSKQWRGHLTIESVPVISDSYRDSVGSHFCGNFCGGLHNTLDNRDMGNSMSSSKRKASISSMWKTSVRESSNQLRVSLSLTLGNDVGSRKSVVWESISISSVGKRSSEDRPHRWVVDERSRSGDDSGGASNNSGVSITLGNDVGSGKSMVWEPKSISIPSIAKRSNSGSKDRSDWWVVDERGGGADHSGCSGKDSGVSISRPLPEIVASKAMVANSNWDGMGSHFCCNFCGGLHNTLHYGDMRDSSN
jgi:hypothetical protein